MTALVRPESRFGRKWGRLIRAAGPTIRAGTNSEELRRAWAMREMAGCTITGPVVYAALGQGDVMWVGSTSQPLRDRIRDHLREPAKARAFTHVVAIPLDYDIAISTMGVLERHGRLLLDPLMGQRWPNRHRARGNNA